ncbi:LacI family DNA-binding transcriptional regulator [Tessaracoccus sp. Z1128]
MADRSLGESSRAASARIRDVANRAGVSVGTVSNTLNHPERVAPATRDAVMAAIRDLGFVPNLQARLLTGAPSNVIALVVLDLMSPFYMEIAHSVERAAREAGHVVMLCNSENDREKESELLKTLAAQRVRGALLSPASGSDNVLDRLDPALPVVILDHMGIERGCAVAVDDVVGGGLASQHLLELGHRRLAFLGGPAGLRQMQQRALGMRETIRAYGLNPDEVLIEVNVEDIGIQGGLDGARRLVEMGDLPTGIVCGNDMLAFGVFRALGRAGVTVPDDVALVGYDDVEFAADWVVPLTSVRQPIQQMGYTAAKLLLSHAGDPDHRHQQVLLHPELVVRKSSGVARPNAG